MQTRKSNSLAVIITVLLILTLSNVSGCNRRSANEKRYELKGKVLTVEKDKHLVTVAHEDIKDFMEGMTMPFTVRDEWAFDVLAPGAQLTATLVVDGTQSWLENLVITTSDSATTTSANLAGEAEAGDEVPNYGLVNQDGKARSIRDYRGKALLLTFIYTRCPIPDYCSLMSNNFAQIDKQLQRQPELYEKTHLVSVSIDPEYDTPAVLRSYGSSHTGNYADETFAHWEFASGTKDQVKDIAQYFGLRYYDDKGQIIHGLRTVIIAPDGKVVKVYRGNEWKPVDVLEDLRAIFR